MSFYNNMDLFREAKEQQSGDKEAYEKFFQATLKKFGADSPQDLEKEKRKEFFDYVNKNWKAQDESAVTEKMARQLKDPKTEVMVVKNNKVKVIDKKDQDKYMKRGYELAESVSSQALDESHFKVGDKVRCKESGMSGKVIKLDKDHGADDEKYYTVRRDDGKEIKYAPNELSAISESNHVTESLGPMGNKMPDADAGNKHGQRMKDKTFKMWHDAATEVRDHPYYENQDGSEVIEPAAQPQTYAIEQIVDKYLSDESTSDIQEMRFDDLGAADKRDFRRREMEYELGDERSSRSSRGSWIITIDGKIYKQRGTIKTFPTQKAATNYSAAIMRSKPNLQGKVRVMRASAA